MKNPCSNAHDLPVDILRDIFATFIPTNDTRNRTLKQVMQLQKDSAHILYQCSLVNWSWYHATIPNLYDTLVIVMNQTQDARIAGLLRHHALIRRLVVIGSSDPPKNTEKAFIRFGGYLKLCTGLRSLYLLNIEKSFAQDHPNYDAMIWHLLSSISSPHLRCMMIRSLNSQKMREFPISVFLNSLPPFVLQNLEEFQLRNWTQDPSVVMKTPPHLPSLKRLVLRQAVFRDNLETWLSALTQSTDLTTPISTISELHMHEMKDLCDVDRMAKFLGINNLGAGLTTFYIKGRWNFSYDHKLLPPQIFNLCPGLQRFFYFAECPLTLLDEIPDNIIDLGLWITDARPYTRLNYVISKGSQIIKWLSDPSKRRNVKRLVIDWESAVGRKWEWESIKTSGPAGMEIELNREVRWWPGGGIGGSYNTLRRT
ncbi:hypothetical protein BDN72DRAFT_834187 [Pluteus cervinus]|uniref:Uncharacterized protein n=1 Tax=Pluteus cervinus TaxID=181527 RepID=A0ACD3B817_9AGAR|nr:hypothetical protein BDN72DRAFT_834187 [Pluteus cervinus]